MKLFRKKTKTEMIESFLKKHKPLDNRASYYEIKKDFYELIKHLKIPHYKYIVLIWAIPMLIISISLLGAFVDIGFLKIFVSEDLSYYQSFINILLNSFLLGVSLTLIIISFTKILLLFF